MQPLPFTGTLTPEELTNPTQHSGTHKHSATSPTASPVLIEKSKQRKRTISLSSPHSTFMTRCEQVQHCATDISYPTSMVSLHMQDFIPNSLEKNILLKMYIFKCILLKHSAHTELPCPQSLINCVRQQSSNTEESKVAYVHILSERANSYT